MRYHGTIEIHAKKGAKFGYKKIKSFYDRLETDLGYSPADDVIDKVVQYVKSCLEAYDSIDTKEISYETDPPESIINISSDKKYSVIIAPRTFRGVGDDKHRNKVFEYSVSFDTVIFKRNDEHVNRRHRTYRNRSRSRSRSRNTRRNSHI